MGLHYGKTAGAAGNQRGGLRLITQESDEYMQALAGEVGELMTEIQIASPYITREAAALTAA